MVVCINMYIVYFCVCSGVYLCVRAVEWIDCLRFTPILRIGDQVLTFDVFWPQHLQEVRSTVYIHVQSI